ncbi:MAG: hypothetical protein WBC37_15550 [Burkholderiaceae bacterium]
MTKLSDHGTLLRRRLEFADALERALKSRDVVAQGRSRGGPCRCGSHDCRLRFVQISVKLSALQREFDERVRVVIAPMHLAIDIHRTHRQQDAAADHGGQQADHERAGGAALERREGERLHELTRSGSGTIAVDAHILGGSTSGEAIGSESGRVLDPPGHVDLLLLRFPQHLDQREGPLPQRDGRLLRVDVALLGGEVGLFLRGLQLRLFLVDGGDELAERFRTLLGGDDPAGGFLAAEDFEDAARRLRKHEDFAGGLGSENDERHGSKYLVERI